MAWQDIESDVSDQRPSLPRVTEVGRELVNSASNTMPTTRSDLAVKDDCTNRDNGRLVSGFTFTENTLGLVRATLRAQGG